MHNSSLYPFILFGIRLAYKPVKSDKIKRRVIINLTIDITSFNYLRFHKSSLLLKYYRRHWQPKSIKYKDYIAESLTYESQNEQN